MKVVKKLFDDCCLFSHDRYVDERGFFQELHRTGEDFLVEYWSQTSYSCSDENTIRGLHCSPYPKYVQCLRGRIYDVVVDLRHRSLAYGKWYGVWLQEDIAESLFIPANCAHGFCSAVSGSILLYMQGGVWEPGKDKNYHFTSFNIEWPVDLNKAIVSDKDASSEVVLL